MLIIFGPCEWSLWSANPYPYGPWDPYGFFWADSWSTDPFGPKGRQLEVRAQRAPRLLVFSFLLTLGVLGVLCGRCLSFVVDVRCGGCCTICCSFSFKLFLIFLPNWLSHNFLPCFHLVLETSFSFSHWLSDFFLIFPSFFIPFFNSFFYFLINHVVPFLLKSFLFSS